MDYGHACKSMSERAVFGETKQEKFRQPLDQLKHAFLDVSGGTS